MLKKLSLYSDDFPKKGLGVGHINRSLILIVFNSLLYLVTFTDHYVYMYTFSLINCLFILAEYENLYVERKSLSLKIINRSYTIQSNYPYHLIDTISLLA